MRKIIGREKKVNLSPPPRRKFIGIDCDERLLFIKLSSENKNSWSKSYSFKKCQLVMYKEKVNQIIIIGKHIQNHI